MAHHSGMNYPIIIMLCFLHFVNRGVQKHAFFLRKMACDQLG